MKITNKNYSGETLTYEKLLYEEEEILKAENKGFDLGLTKEQIKKKAKSNLDKSLKETE